MSDIELHISERATELKRAFDRSFVEVQHFEPVVTEDFLSIHVGGDPHMLRLTEIAGLFVDKKITILPSRVAELKGVAGFRGEMVPVYDLSALLRYPPSSATRWMVIAAAARVALAFDAFDGHFRFPAAAVASRDVSESGEHLSQIVRAENFVRPVINVPSLVAAIRTRASASSLQ